VSKSSENAITAPLADLLAEAGSSLGRGEICLAYGASRWSYDQVLAAMELKGDRRAENDEGSLSECVGFLTESSRGASTARVVERASKLMSAIGDVAKLSFSCTSKSPSDLWALTAAMCWRSGGVLHLDSRDSDVLVVDELPPDTEPLPEALVLAFAGTEPPRGRTDELASRRRPVWLIEEVPHLGVDLLAVRAAGGARESIALADTVVTDTKGRVVLPGLFGEVSVRYPNSGERLPTGVVGKRVSGGRLFLADYLRGSVRIGGKSVGVEDVERTLRATRGVTELVALGRRDGSGRAFIVVYYSSRPGVVRDEIEEELRNRSGLVDRLLAIDIPAIPFTRRGEPDWRAIADIPVVDRFERERVAQELVAAHGVDVSTTAASTIESVRTLPPTTIRRVSVSTSQQGREPDESAGGGEAVLAGPSLELPTGHAELVFELLDYAASRHANTEITCIESGGVETVSYARLAADAQGAAGWLCACGLSPGDRVVLCADRLRVVLTWFWAAQYAGLCTTVLTRTGDPSLDDKKLREAVDLLQAKAVIGDRLAEERIGDARCVPAEPVPKAPYRRLDLPPESVALVLLTSGSEGRPKLVPQSHRALIAQGQASGPMLGLTPDDVSMNWMPLGHVGGLVMFHLRDVQTGCSQVQVSQDHILGDLNRWFQIVSELGVTVSWSPNFGFGLLTRHMEQFGCGPWSLRSLRFLINGGEAIVADTARKFLSLGAEVGLRSDCMKPAWGMSETCSLATVDASGDVRHDARTNAVLIGRPIAGVEVRIVRDGAVATVGQIGELEIRGATVMRGYAGGGGDGPDPNGWFKTGDLAMLTAGELVVTGRAKDTIIVNGQNLSCVEVESLIAGVPSIDPVHVCAVAHRPEQADTECVAVFVVPGSGADQRRAVRDVRSLLYEKLHAEALVIPVTESVIPRTEIGKPKRAELQRQLRDGLFDDLITEFSEFRRSEQLPAWFFGPTWVKQARLRLARDGSRSRVGVLTSSAGATAAIRKAVEEVGFAREVVDVSQRESATATVSFDTLIVHWDAADEARAGDLAVDFLSTIRSLPKSEAFDAFMITSDALGSDRRPSPVAAARLGALLGLWRSCSFELPQYTFRWLDFSGDASWRKRIEIVAAEAASCPRSCVVRLKDGERLVQRLAQQSFGARATASPLRREGRYVVVGALGGIGSLVSHRLIREWSAHVIGLGRSASSGLDERARSRYERLRSSGRFDYLSADATRAGEVDRAVESALGDDATVDGVFHLGGSFRTHSLESLTEDEYLEHVRRKAEATLHLVNFLERYGVNARLLVLFGSVNSVFPGTGSIAHTAACSSQEMICEALTDHPTIKCRYLGWSQWGGVGLAADHVTPALAERSGFMNVLPAQGLASLDIALSAGLGATYIGLDAANERVAASLDQLAVTRRMTVHAHAAGMSTRRERVDVFGRPYSAEVDSPDEPGSAEGAEGYRRLEQQLVAIWREVLERQDIDVKRSFFEIGGNSLKLLQVKGKVEERFGSRIEIEVFFRYPTVRALAVHFADTNETPAETRVAEIVDRGAKRLAHRSRVGRRG
jgi:acyl-CoA synthetase (AMP-forming)/AMP-acid ligase II/acyl carrier protein